MTTLTEWRALARKIADENAARGARWLDRKYPDWYNRVKITRLDLTNGCLCVFGQLQPDVENGLIAILDRTRRAKNDTRWSMVDPRRPADWFGTRYGGVVEYLEKRWGYRTKWLDRHGFTVAEFRCDEDTNDALYDAIWPALNEAWGREIRTRRGLDRRARLMAEV